MKPEELRLPEGLCRSKGLKGDTKGLQDLDLEIFMKMCTENNRSAKTNAKAKMNLENLKKGPHYIK